MAIAAATEAPNATPPKPPTSVEGVEMLRLVRIDFDNLENHKPIRETEIGSFITGAELTAHGKIEAYFHAMAPERRYLGCDGHVYPRYRVEKKVAR